MSEHLKFSTGKRLLLFLIILAINSLVGAALLEVFRFTSDLGLKITQGISSILMFVVPPIVYYYLTRERHPMRYLGFRNDNKSWYLYIIVGVVLMFISLPMTNQLTRWNEAINFGGAFAKLEEYLKMLEETAAATTEKMLNVNTIGGLLLNLLVIALIPAIGEEMTFRGVLQQGLTRSMKNPHIAIVLSAAIFSFIHFQFYGFLPRMFLGILLGYMFYVSGSLWTCIAMHFVNNGTAVLLYYLNSKDIIDIDPDHFGETQYVWLLVASLVMTVTLIVWSWWNENNARKGDD